MTYQFAVDLFHLTLLYTLPAIVWFEYFHKFINPWKRVKFDYLLVSMAHFYVILLQSFNKWGDLILHSSIKENNFELFAMYIKKQRHICIWHSFFIPSSSVYPKFINLYQIRLSILCIIEGYFFQNAKAIIVVNTFNCSALYMYI